MIVQRFTFRVKIGKMEEALEVGKEARRIWPGRSGRLYSSNVGPMNTLVFDNVAENMEELEKLWDQCKADDRWAPLIDRWRQLIAEEGPSELWNLEEYDA